MTTKVDRRLTPLVEGEFVELAARLNAMIEHGTLVIVFQPYAKSTEFAFMGVGTPSGREGILAIAKVAGDAGKG